MSVKTHVLDFSGVAVASIVATALDGLVFAALLAVGWTHGWAALVAAVFGGIVHYSACRLIVFRRFATPVAQSLPRYVAMSGSAALTHAGVVSMLGTLLAAGVAWGVSKALVYVAWTYPLSRYFVFDTPASQEA